MTFAILPKQKSHSSREATYHQWQKNCVLHCCICLSIDNPTPSPRLPHLHFTLPPAHARSHTKRFLIPQLFFENEHFATWKITKTITRKKYRRNKKQIRRIKAHRNKPNDYNFYILSLIWVRFCYYDVLRLPFYWILFCKIVLFSLWLLRLRNYHFRKIGVVPRFSCLFCLFVCLYYISQTNSRYRNRNKCWLCNARASSIKG